MARDDALRALFTDTAASSGGALTFRVTTSALLAQEFGLMLARSRNPVYVFGVTGASGERLTCVAFTLALDGMKRQATRAEALGRSLAYSEGQLFDLNPFMLVYDYAGERLLAAPATDLFGAFAEYASYNALPYAESASFSLTPNFQYSTINMYAELRTPTVWATSTDQDDFSADDLVAFLRRVTEDTAARRTEFPAIVEAIKTRISAAPSGLETSGDTETALTLEGPETDYAYLEPRDDEVQVEDRLWRIILAAIESSAAVILVGPPGTGKSMLVRKAVGTISENRQVDGLPGIKRPLWATPDESWTFRELIGGETVAGGDIVFRPGWVLRAIADNRWLVLDEANRGDLDRIFGALLTWLAGEDVTVGVESSATDAKQIELGRTSGQSRVEIIEGTDGRRGAIRYLAGEDWKLLGTYNALDAQRVFRIGAALGRRFVRVPIPPISPSLFDQVLERRAGDLPDELRTKIGLLYDAHYQDEVTRLGQALFLGMCSYLKHAVQSRVSGSSAAEDGADTTTPGNAEQLSLGPLPEAGTSGSDFGSEAAAAEGNNPTMAQGSMGSILSEAYVLNLGTFLAQLEGPDFERLAYRIQASSALSQKEVEWVSEMMRALA
jgi:MoxR-like ATPase